MNAAPVSPLPTRLATFGARRLLILLALVASQLLLVVIPSQAHAAITTWSQESRSCGGYAEERGSGQMDASGRLYVACTKADSGVADPSIRIYGPTGVLERIVSVAQRPGDVAPTPDGKTLFVLNFVTKVTQRYDWNPTRVDRDGGIGSYQLNTSWSAADVPGRGAPRGEFIATDAVGGLYISSGLWVPGAPDLVAKYDYNGTYVTSFGSLGTSWALGVGYDEFTGLAVTANGNRVFVAEKLNSRVERWDRQGNGTYAATVAFGNSAATDPTRQGQCAQDGLLAAPYDVALTPGGEVVVISTTCYYTDPNLLAVLGVPSGTFEVQRYRQDGLALGTVRGTAVYGVKIHGIAVDRLGSIYALEGGVVLKRPAGLADAGNDMGGGGPMGGAAAVAPAPIGGGAVPGTADLTAPVIDSINATVAAGSKDVTMVIHASDDRGVVNVRVTEEGSPFAWRTLTNPITHTMGAYGTRTLSIVVNDAAGNVSGAYNVRVTTVAPAAAPAPAPTTPAKPAATPSKPGVATKPGTPTAPLTPNGQAAPNVGVADHVAPVIVAVKLPVEVNRGRRISVALTARDNVAGGMQVRFATENGRWGAWQSLKGRRALMLSPGVGWKGLFTQVRDAAGNRSQAWFQTVFAAPRGSSWKRGTNRADVIRGTGRADHIDASQFDRGAKDRISCGRGYDTVLLQAGDVAASDCEHVVRLVTPKF